MIKLIEILLHWFISHLVY